MTTPRRCPAIGCDQAAPTHPFCRGHWNQIDPYLQYEVTKHHNDYDRAIACDRAAVHVAWLAGQADATWLTAWFDRRAAQRVAAQAPPPATP